MKKWLLLCLMLLLFVLMACSEEEADPAQLAQLTKTNTPDTTIETVPPEESYIAEDNGVWTLEDDIENYIDGMVFWTSFEIGNDFYKRYDADEQIDEEYHEAWGFITDPVEMYFYAHSIGFSNSHLEQYANDSEAFIRFDMGDWEEVPVNEVLFDNPIGARITLLNIAVSSEGEVSVTDTQYTKDIDPANMQEVITSLHEEVYMGMFEEDVDFSSMQLIITVSPEHITEIQLVANGTTVEGNSVEFDFKERYTSVNSLTEVERPM